MNALDTLSICCQFSDVRPPLPKYLEIPRVRSLSARTSQHVLATEGQSTICSIFDVEPIYESGSTSVYRATLHIDGAESVDVVIKTDIYTNTPRPDAFVREMEAYERDLLRFQGMIIPRCYGLYQARICEDDDDDENEDEDKSEVKAQAEDKDEDEDDLVSFLILEYVGQPINYRNLYPRELVVDIINKVANIHRAGFEHGDLDDRNILVDENDNAMLIDLEDVTPHNCGVKHSIIFNDLQPKAVDFGCKEIHHTVFMLHVWQEACVKFYGTPVYLDSIVPGAADKLVYRVRYLIDTEEQHEQAIKDAERLIENVETWREWYNTITDEERYFKFKPEPESSSSSDASVSDSSSHSDDTCSTSFTDSSSPMPSDLK